MGRQPMHNATLSLVRELKVGGHSMAGVLLHVCLLKHDKSLMSRWAVLYIRLEAS